MGPLLWPSLRLKPVITATTLDFTVITVDFLVMATNKTGPVPVLMDFHPHAGVAVARDRLMLMPNLHITVMDLMDTTLDLMDTLMDLETVVMDSLLDLSPTEAHKV